MSLLLDALNRAQKNKENEADLSEAANDEVLNEEQILVESENILDMEGLDFGEVKASKSANDAGNSKKKEETEVFLDRQKYELALEADEIASENPNVTDDVESSDIARAEQKASERVDADINQNKQPDSSSLSLEESHVDTSSQAFLSRNLPNGELGDEKTNRDSNPETEGIVEAKRDMDIYPLKLDAEKDVSADKNFGTSDGDVGFPENLDKTSISELVHKNSVSPNSQAINKENKIKLARKKHKSRRTLGRLFYVLLVCLSLASAGYYYYFEQMKLLSDAGKIPDKYVGRSLTPAGAEPPDEMLDEKHNGKLDENGFALGTVKEKIKNAVSEIPSSQIIRPVVEKAPLSKRVKVRDKTSNKKQVKKAKTEVSVRLKVKNKPKIKRVKARRATKKTKPRVTKKSKVSIRKQKVANPTHSILVEAFSAFQTGDDSIAAQKYQQVLDLERNNRDALLGLAAIAVRQKKMNLARNYYTQLLKRNGADSMARAALVGLVGQMDPIKAETELKLMINEEPSAGYLHFALGNIYALQHRWIDAQNSFFNAYRINSGSADYAYNVAISLEHLGERRSAIRYYSEALANAENKVVSFDKRQVKQRLSTLELSDTGPK